MTASNPVRVGFIGTGWAERVQIPAFKAAGLRPTAISSGRIKNARRAAEKHQIPHVFSDWRELVEAEDVDLVSIVTPPALHKEIAVAALQAGKHVICEKPMALNVAEAEEMFAASQKAPNLLALIDHELRLLPQRRRMRDLFRQGKIGQGVWAEFRWNSARRLDQELAWNWWSDAEQGGGALGAVGSHLLDMARWTLGRIDALTCQLKTGVAYRRDQTGTETRVTADDLAHIALKFGSGLEGSIHVNAIAAGQEGMSVLLTGTSGSLYLDEAERIWYLPVQSSHQSEWEAIDVEDPIRTELGRNGLSSFQIATHYLAQHLVETLAQKGEPWSDEMASFYDGLKVQKMLDAAHLSNREQRWINL